MTASARVPQLNRGTRAAAKTPKRSPREDVENEPINA